MYFVTCLAFVRAQNLIRDPICPRLQLDSFYMLVNLLPCPRLGETTRGPSKLETEQFAPLKGSVRRLWMVQELP